MMTTATSVDGRSVDEDHDDHAERERVPLVIQVDSLPLHKHTESFPRLDEDSSIDDALATSNRGPLTTSGASSSRQRPAPSLRRRPRRRRLRCIRGWWPLLGMVILLCGVYYFAWVLPANTAVEPSHDHSDPSRVKRPASPQTGSFVPSEYASIPLLANTTIFQSGSTYEGSEFYSLDNMRLRFDLARQRLMRRLEGEYGAEVLQRGLLGQKTLTDTPVSALRSAGPSDLSRDRWKRQLALKLLEVQLRLGQGEHGEPQQKMVPYVWASGGHSAAAAHGNLYNESYTAVLERGVREIFAQTGLWFQARNYAMGGTASGPEVALCEEAIFGLDVDVLSWDFGMTDGRNAAIFELYFTRAGIHPNRPVGVGLEVQGGGVADRLRVMQHLEEAGLPMLYLDDRVKLNAIDVIPDCGSDLSEAQIHALPTYVRNFKCNGAVEKGGPFCDVSKWTNVTGYCPSRPKFRTGWHPGWKWHALVGNLVGISLIGILDDAIKDLELRLGTTTPQALYVELKTQENADSIRFRGSAISRSYDMLDPKPRDEALNLAGLFRRRCICHTAMLPSESRYKGILTMNTSLVGLSNYDKGVSREQVDQEDDYSSNSVRLVYDSSDRQDCDVLEIDFKDYFYLTEREGWKELILPNQAELDVYQENEGKEYDCKGLIAIALKPCSWGRCKPDDVRENGLDLSEFEMQVNGVQVTNLTKFYTMQFLRHEQGHSFVPSDTGQYVIRLRIKKQGKSLRLTSFVFF